jgi:hypothetical protein
MPVPHGDGAFDLLIGNFRKADRGRLVRQSDDLAQSLFGLHSFSFCPPQGVPPELTGQCAPQPLDRGHQTQDRGRPCP